MKETAFLRVVMLQILGRHEGFSMELPHINPIYDPQNGKYLHQASAESLPCLGSTEKKLLVLCMSTSSPGSMTSPVKILIINDPAWPLELFAYFPILVK